MKISKLLLAATGIEAVAVGSLLAISGLLAGAPGLSPTLTGWLDVINQFGPIIVILLAAGLVLTFIGLERRRAKRVFLGVGLLALIFYSPPFVTEYGAWIGNTMRSSPPAAGDLTVLQFNVLQINHRPELAESVILDTSADVLTLQEPHPHILNSATLWAAYPYRTECVGYCLVMIMSKRPITDWAFQAIGTEDGASGAMNNKVEVVWADTTAPDGRPVRVMTTHYFWPIPAPPQRQQREALAKFLKGQDKRELILAADFNLTPWSYALRRQDEAVKPLTRRSRAIYSWPAYIPRLWRPTHFTALPIDHVYAGPSWRTVSIGRTVRGASDHYPILARFRRAAAAAAPAPVDSSPRPSRP